MKRIAAGILVGSVAVGLLAGCGASTSNTPTTSPAAKAEPQTLNLNLGTEPPMLDSAQATDSASFSVLEQVQEGLVRLDKDGKANQGSGAAASWTVSPDGLTYTFTLKDNLKWSDGKPLTSKDFAYAWTRALDPKTASQYNFILFYIKGGEAFASLNPKDADFATKYEAAKKALGLQTPNDKTLIVTLASPTAYFAGLTNFPTYFPQREDIVAQYGDKFAAEAANQVYSGPFVIKTWTHQNELVIEKNPNYWDASNVKLTSVDFKMIKESNTYVNMFESGQLDSTGLPGSLVPQYKDKPGFFSMTRPRSWYLEFNSSAAGKPYLANPHIRKAFSLAIDRAGFAASVLRDGSPAADGLVPNSIMLDKTTYRSQAGPMIKTSADVAAAQTEFAAGLKELGIDKLPPIEFISTDDDLSKKYAQGIQGMVQSALSGVTLNLLPLDFKTRLDRMRKGNFEMVLTGWGADYNDPMTFMDMWIKGSPYNDGKWNNDQYTALIKDAQTSNDQAKRLDDFKKAEQILMNEMPVSPVYFSAANSVTKPYVKNLVFLAMGPTWDLKNVSIEGRQ